MSVAGAHPARGEAASPFLSEMTSVSFFPAEKHRPRRGPMWPLQLWADAHPVQGLLLVDVSLVLVLALAVDRLVVADGGDRQYERTKNW